MKHLDRVVTVELEDGRRAKVRLSKCISWAERHPKKTYTIYLHRTSKGQFIKEKRYHRSNHRNYSYLEKPKWAAYWLIENDYVIPKECKQYDERIDILDTSSEMADYKIVNYCLNCMRLDMSIHLPSVSEGLILEALDDATLLGKEIAEKAGMSFNSNFRAALARLVATGYLEKVKGRKGYKAIQAMS